MTECHNRSCSIPFIYVLTQLVPCIDSTYLAPALWLNMISILLTRLHWVQYYDSIQLILILIIKRIDFNYLFRIPFNYLSSDVSPSPSTWNMVKDSPNHVPMNMIDLSHTSHKIIEDGDVPIFPVFLSTLDPLQLSLNYHYDRTGTPLSTFCVEVNTIYIWPLVQCQRTTRVCWAS